MSSSARGSIASGASSVFYSQHQLNFDDLKVQEFHPEPRYFQDKDTHRPSLGSISRILSSRPSIASISSSVGRGKR